MAKKNLTLVSWALILDLELKKGGGAGLSPPSKDLEAILKKQIEAIEAGKVLVDLAILKEAKEAISHETGGVAEPPQNFSILDMLQGVILTTS